MKENYESHLQMKKRAHEETNSDKERTKSEPTFVTATFDLQSVLQIASLTVLLQAEVDVLQFDCLCKKGFCSLWDQTNVCRGSTKIATCLWNYLDKLPQSVKIINVFG